jgi:hypothetical protein
MLLIIVANATNTPILHFVSFTDIDLKPLFRHIVSDHAKRILGTVKNQNTVTAHYRNNGTEQSAKHTERERDTHTHNTHPTCIISVKTIIKPEPKNIKYLNNKTPCVLWTWDLTCAVNDSHNTSLVLSRSRRDKR